MKTSNTPPVDAQLGKSVIDSASPETPAPRIPPDLPRLRLSPSLGRGALDGAWWPHSRDLKHELADLVDHFPPKIGRIAHVVYSPPDWRPAPRRIPVAGGFVKAGSFPGDDNHRVLLTLANGRIVHLLVVPPSLPRSSAVRAMHDAASPTNLERADSILRRVQETETADARAHWSDDGGSWGAPAPHRAASEGMMQ